MSSWLAGLAELPPEVLGLMGTGIAVLLGAIATAWRGLRARPPAPPPPPPFCVLGASEMRDLRDRLDEVHDLLVRLEDRSRGGR